jgi:hypothetical protein
VRSTVDKNDTAQSADRLRNHSHDEKRVWYGVAWRGIICGDVAEQIILSSRMWQVK